MLVDRFIKLVTDERLPRPAIRSWFNSVSSQAPSGVINPISIDSDDHERHVTRLIHQVRGDNRHAYVIPLTRNLHPSEVDQIVEIFAKAHPSLDFDVETNDTRLRAKDDGMLPIDSKQHLALCLAFAKQQHEDWLRERGDAGWRFGEAFDADAKTHPLLRPWDQLPDRYKQPDLDWPQKLVSLLNANGYVVLQRETLDRLMSHGGSVEMSSV